VKLELASSSYANWPGLMKVLDPSVLDKGSKDLRAYASVVDEWFGTPSHESEHIFISFYFELDQLTTLLVASETDIKVTFDIGTRELFGLMSGTLKQWNDAVKKCCTEEQNMYVRGFMNGVYLYLEQLGLRFPYSKLELKDRTFAWK
jgi:hypothetical protein